MKLGLTYLLIIISVVALAATGKDTLTLNEVVKVESAGSNVPSYNSPFSDLKYLQGQRVSDALGQFSSVYIKSYGSGGLASLAIRGTSASQTEVQWNGVKLNSPSLGQVDLALFTIGVPDDLQLVRSGYQGTIGGTLRMNNEIRIDSGFSLGATFRVGSFKTYEALVDGQFAKGNVSGATKFSYLNSQNNFTFHNTFKEGSPLQKQSNAAVTQISFLQQMNFKLNEHHQLGFYLWVTDAARQIAPIMSQDVSMQTQDDYSIRAMMDWKGEFGKLKVKFTSAYLYDWMRYKDPLANLNEVSTTGAVRNNLSFAYNFPYSIQWRAELNYDHEDAHISSYGVVRTRNILGFRTYADHYFSKGFRLHAGFREDLVDKKLSAFAPELGLNYAHRVKQDHILGAGILASRNFRFPTLNDLYWNPGGNPNLKQEKAVNGEIQLKYGYKQMVDISVSNFYIYVDNWIQWIPQGSIWMPVNFKRVFSRGVEAALHLTNADAGHPYKLFVVHFNASYTFTKTTNLDAASQFDQSKGMQLIYVPLHNVVAGLQLKYRGLFVRSVNNYTGMVYTATDNSQSLKGYFVSNLEFGSDMNLKDADLGISFRVNNIGNTQYQAVAQRPMPGRNFEGIFRLKLFK